MHIMKAEAAQIVLNIPIKKTMIPLNVTHTAIVTRKWQAELLAPGSHIDETQALPPPQTPLRHMLSTLISFFAEAYETVFGFVQGPPIHDALTIVYFARPELFGCRRYHVDIELTGVHTVGETVVDLWDYQKADDTWGRTGKNCVVAESLNVSAMGDGSRTMLTVFCVRLMVSSISSWSVLHAATRSLR
jgi:uridine nucleosidase